MLSIVGGFLAVNRIQFAFDFEQFFPKGDDDLKFFLEFKENFEPDDNFLLVGINNDEGVFKKEFLEKVLEFSLESRRINFEVTNIDSIDNNIYVKEMNASGDSIIRMNPVLSSQSLVQIEFPIRNIFTGISFIPALHIEDTSLYAKDIKKIMQDKRLVNNLVSEDGKMLVVVLKTIDNIQQDVASKLLSEVRKLLKKQNFEDYHLLGKSYFQTEIVRIQVEEFFLTMSISFFLVFWILLFLFKRIWGIIIALVSISVGLMMFVGMMGLFAQELNTMALLYPLIMIIVATSDVIHVMSKYTDELHLGATKDVAIRTTLREIGMSIFLTSTTTAIGFLSLTTSRLIPVQQFGINAAMGVMVAYITVIIFTTTILTLFSKEQIIKLREKPIFWITWMEWVYEITKTHKRSIIISIAILLVVCFIGISKITTNASLRNILPNGAKVTEDFMHFERVMSGFRPFEIAVSLQGDHEIDDFKVVQEIEKLENYFESIPDIKSVTSITDFYKSINQAYNGNKQSAFILPDNAKQFKKYKKLARRMSKGDNFGVLVSKDKKHTRISAKVLDIGVDKINLIRAESKKWVSENIDTSIIKSRITGTGIIIDKNSDYIRDSLIKGLLLALLVISIIISLIYRNIKMLILSLIPNIIPMLIAAAIIGFWAIPFEAGVAIVFAIIFGIAIDDTIHLLSKFKLTKDKGYSTEHAIKITLVETGKALCFTTLILFVGFLSLYISSSPPAFRIGMLMSSTLISALVCDLLIIPIMLRKWF
ncbi:MAG: MMPL family transporter [Saprospiraceae bacterium]|nr:MMPL family transporter [Saprospiraceae bacterium]